MARTKILLVEEDRIVIKTIKNRLMGLGYPSPVTASSGTEAIKQVGRSHPDLALVGIQLKGEMDGIEVARQIHDRFDIPVVYLLNDPPEETLRDKRGVDPFFYILKPYEENAFRISIERALYHHRMGRVWKSLSNQPLSGAA